MFALAVLASLSLLAAAAPSGVNVLDVPIEVCNATNVGFVSGTLTAASGSPRAKGFFFDGTGHLAFNARRPGALAIAFEGCVPNFGGFPNAPGGPVAGHLTIPPGSNTCLAIDFGPPSPNVTLPLSLARMPCSISDDSGQINFTFLKYPNGTIFWIGDSFADGSFEENFGGCASGNFGYVPNAQGVPANGRVGIACAGPATGLGFIVN